MPVPNAMLDEIHLRSAIRLAMNGRGMAEPNPTVGCVLVKDGQVIGQGYHAKFGGPHAEAAALADCRERGHSPAGATAYITLEPCCHTNKKTPPCAPRVIEAGISRAVISCLDPNPAVNGKGVAMLRQAGIDVTVGLVEAEAKQLIASFILANRNVRPYVTLKWAETADGRIAGPAGRRMQITGEASQRLVQELRSRCGGILVGVNTVLIDDPLLTARLSSMQRHPQRFILDSRLRTPKGAAITQDRSAPTHLLYAQQNDSDALHRREAMLALGVEPVALLYDDHGRVEIEAALRHIRSVAVTELLVEPGPTLAQSFFDSGLIDRVWRFRSPARVDDSTAPLAATVPADYVTSAEVTVGDDRLTEYLNPHSEVYYAPTASADIRLYSEDMINQL